MSDHNKKDWQKFKEDNLVDEDFFDEPTEEESSDELNHVEQALDHPSYSDLEEKLTLAEQQAHENWEKSVRAIAELDNVRRRMEREVTNAHKYGVEKLLSSLLPVMDSLEQALQLADKNNDSAMHEGLELTMKLFLDVLQKFEVEQIDPMGQAFDPQQHEAMSMQPAPDAAPNTVIMVFQKGYKLSDRVIRPARVVVSTK
jgi:molecular chaperone GrpE